MTLEGYDCRPLLLNMNSIAAVSTDSQGRGEVRLKDEYIYTVKEDTSAILDMIRKGMM